MSLLGCDESGTLNQGRTHPLRLSLFLIHLKLRAGFI